MLLILKERSEFQPNMRDFPLEIVVSLCLCDGRCVCFVYSFIWAINCTSIHINEGICQGTHTQKRKKRKKKKGV